MFSSWVYVPKHLKTILLKIYVKEITLKELRRNMATEIGLFTYSD